MPYTINRVQQRPGQDIWDVFGQNDQNLGFLRQAGMDAGVPRYDQFFWDPTNRMTGLQEFGRTTTLPQTGGAWGTPSSVGDYVPPGAPQNRGVPDLSISPYEQQQFNPPPPAAGTGAGTGQGGNGSVDPLPPNLSSSPNVLPDTTASTAPSQQSQLTREQIAGMLQNAGLLTGLSPDNQVNIVDLTAAQLGQASPGNPLDVIGAGQTVRSQLLPHQQAQTIRPGQSPLSVPDVLNAWGLFGGLSPDNQQNLRDLVLSRLPANAGLYDVWQAGMAARQELGGSRSTAPPAATAPDWTQNLITGASPTAANPPPPNIGTNGPGSYLPGLPSGGEDVANWLLLQQMSRTSVPDLLGTLQNLAMSNLSGPFGMTPSEEQIAYERGTRMLEEAEQQQRQTALEEMNRRGILRSGITVDQLGQIGKGGMLARQNLLSDLLTSNALNRQGQRQSALGQAAQLYGLGEGNAQQQFANLSSLLSGQRAYQGQQFGQQQDVYQQNLDNYIRQIQLQSTLNQQARNEQLRRIAPLLTMAGFGGSPTAGLGQAGNLALGAQQLNQDEDDGGGFWGALGQIASTVLPWALRRALPVP